MEEEEGPRPKILRLLAMFDISSWAFCGGFCAYVISTGLVCWLGPMCQFFFCNFGKGPLGLSDWEKNHGKYALKRVSFGSKDCTKELNPKIWKFVIVHNYCHFCQKNKLAYYCH